MQVVIRIIFISSSTLSAISSPLIWTSYSILALHVLLESGSTEVYQLKRCISYVWYTDCIRRASNLISFYQLLFDEAHKLRSL